MPETVFFYLHHAACTLEVCFGGLEPRYFKNNISSRMRAAHMIDEIQLNIQKDRELNWAMVKDQGPQAWAA